MQFFSGWAMLGPCYRGGDYEFQQTNLGCESQFQKLCGAVSKNKHPFSTFRKVSPSPGVACNPSFRSLFHELNELSIRNSANCLQNPNADRSR